LDKDRYPLFYKPYKIPCGYTEGRKTGIKSAAYLLRKELVPGQILVSDKGVAFNFLYMGDGFTSYSSKDAIDFLKDGKDIIAEFNIRYVGIAADYPKKIYIETIEKMGFNKLILEYKGKEIYYIYDVAKKNGVKKIIGRDEFDVNYNDEYINVFTALPYYAKK
jgi:hypothetical protein